MGAGAVGAGVKEALEKATDEEVKAAVAKLTPDDRAKIKEALAKLSSAAKKRTAEEVKEVFSVPLQEDLTALGLLTADALQDLGWGAVDRTTIVVKNNSGAGGSQTYKVLAKDVTPAAVALHSRMSSLSPKSEARTKAACILFGEAGLAPKRLATGKDWFIEPWAGYGEPQWKTVADMQVLGGEVAKIHKIPTDWYDSFRKELKEDFKFYEKAPDSSHVWWYSCRTEDLFNMQKINEDPEEYKWVEQYVQPYFEPITKAGSRIVTCHGDHQAGNIVSLMEDRSMVADKVLFVDLEFAHVCNAISDLAYVCFHYEDMPRKDQNLDRDDPEAMRRTFLKSYLEAMGDPATDQDVNNLYIESALASCMHHWGFMALTCGEGHDNELIKKFKKDAADLLTLPDEQKQFHEVGAEAWFAVKGWKETVADMGDRLDHFAFLKRIANSNTDGY